MNLTHHGIEARNVMGSYSQFALMGDSTGWNNRAISIAAQINGHVRTWQEGGPLQAKKA